jgi:hypothetical protein
MAMAMAERSQDGQALVGVLAVMLIIFALAGGVSIAASTVLSQQARQRAVFTDDFRAQNAASDALAQVAGTTGQCSPPPHVLTIQIPSEKGSDLLNAYCTRIDPVSSNQPAYVHITWPSGSNCSLTPLTGVSGKQWIFFNARSTGGWAYVDKNTNAACQPIPPGCPLAASSTKQNCPLSNVEFGDGQTPVTQAALPLCDFGDQPSTWYLHIRSSTQSPQMAFSSPRDSNGGAMYLIVAPVPNPNGPTTYEEALMSVSRDRSSSQLRYEAPLP